MSELDNNEYVVEAAEETGQGSDVASTSVYETAGHNGKAFGIVSLVCGIVSFPFLCCVIGDLSFGTYFALAVAIASIVFGILSISRKEDAKGMAIAGIICGSIAVALIMIVLVAYGNANTIADKIRSRVDRQ